MLDRFGFCGLQRNDRFHRSKAVLEGFFRDRDLFCPRDVEQEDFSKPMPAAKASNEDDDEVQDREGRNPRFFEDDDS